MPKVSPIQTSFSGGELGPQLEGRVDLDEYQIGVKRCENFIPTIQGPAVRRGGTRYVHDVKDHADRTWLARFEFNVEQAYEIEFGDLYIRFYTNHGVLLETGLTITGITQANPGVLTYTGTDPSNGDEMFLSGIGGMTQLNGMYVKVANVNAGANTFELTTTAGANINTTTYGAYTSGGTAARVYTVTSPYALADLTDADGNFRLKFVQSGDVIYIVHPSYAPRKLSRVGATNWTFSTVDFLGGPFEDLDPDTATTVYASAETGNGITLTASSAIFTANHVGALFYLERKLTDDTLAWETATAVGAGVTRKSDGKYYSSVNAATTGSIRPTHTIGSAYDGNAGVQWTFLHPGYGYVKITAIGGGGTTATADVIKRLPAEVVGVAQATTRWAFGDWSAANGYPSHVTFFKERLVMARASDQRVWMSVVGDYEDFSDRDDGGLVVADMAITVDIVSDQVNRIEWMVPADVLLIGTAGGEHIIRELTTNEPLGPANVTAIKISEYGSAPVQPVRVGDSILFVQRAGRKVRELAFSVEANSAAGYASIDLSILAPHLVPRGTYITQLAFQQEPHSVVWAVRSDGLLLAVRYNSNRKAVAWSRHPIGGSAVVEAIDTIPHPDGDRDELWLIVKRTINAATKRYVEFLEVEWEDGDDEEDRFYVDSGLTYDGAAATTISGLTHLEGATVDVLADGAAHPQRTVYAGAITLSRSASVVQVGLPCPAKLQLLRMNAGAADGTSQGKVKRIHLMTLRFLDTLGGKIGPNEGELDIIPFRLSADPMDNPPPAFTGDKTDIAWPAGYETDAYVWYVNDQPLPATVVAVMPQLNTQDR